jgi:hypothetical protein
VIDQPPSAGTAAPVTPTGPVCEGGDAFPVDIVRGDGRRLPAVRPVSRPAGLVSAAMPLL